jgi:hypothetical protein
MSARIFAHPAMELRHLHDLYQQYGLKVHVYQARTRRHRWYLMVELTRERGTAPRELVRSAR